MNKQFYTLALVLIFGIFATPIFAQFEISDFKDDSSDAYFLNPDLAISEISFFDNYKSELGLSENDEMEIKSVEEDELDLTHTRYRQYYKGIEVEGGTYILHSNDGSVIIANGELIEGLDLENSPTISESEALEIALAEINAKEYAWQNKDWENELKTDLENEDATYYPVGKIIYAKEYLSSAKAENYHLAYKFEVVCSNPDEGYTIYIDAINGNYLKKYPLGFDCTNYVGSATMLYYGNHSFNVNSAGANYDLEDCTRGNGIKTKWAEFLPSSITDDNGAWGTDDQKGTTTHWLAQVTWDYYYVKHGRNGMNNSGCQLDMRADWSQANAEYRHFLGNDKIRIGTIDNYLSVLDVIGHEFTHGVIQYTANLEYENESGALNESFSDIFGTAVERYSVGSNDWDIAAPATILRSMEDPNDYGDPDTYQGTF